MRFYYISIFSVMLLGLIYLIGTGLLAWFGIWLRKRWKRAWMVMVPLFLLLYAGPVAEEFWIAWNFGQLCKKDAGLFVYKTVEVAGFYDSTRTTHAGPRNKQAAEDLDRGGYQFYEMVSPNYEGGPNKVVHLERVKDIWTATVIDQPTARYHYSRDIYGTRAGHKITRQEARITDATSGEVVGRYVEYGRRPYWFFVALGQTPYSCDGPDAGPTSKHNSLIYRDVLKPGK